jgi:hypothetical protein
MIFWGMLIAGGVLINLAFLHKEPAFAVIAGILYAIAIGRA